MEKPQVYTAKIEAIITEAHEGSVWNLETEDKEYIVHNLVVHNCPHGWQVNYEKITRDQCRYLWMGA